MKKYSILIFLFIFQFHFSQSIEFEGSVSNKNFITADNSAEIDFSTSNLASTRTTENNITLRGMKNGGAYTLICTSTSRRNNSHITFQADGLPIVYMGTNPRTPGKEHIYSFIVVGNKVYVTMATQN